MVPDLCYLHEVVLIKHNLVDIVNSGNCEKYRMSPIGDIVFVVVE